MLRKAVKARDDKGVVKVPVGSRACAGALERGARLGRAEAPTMGPA